MKRGILRFGQDGVTILSQAECLRKSGKAAITPLSPVRSAYFPFRLKGTPGWTLTAMSASGADSHLIQHHKKMWLAENNVSSPSL